MRLIVVNCRNRIAGMRIDLISVELVALVTTRYGYQILGLPFGKEAFWRHVVSRSPTMNLFHWRHDRP